MKIIKFTQQGKRSNNEDCFGVSEGLVTVCDGMGGHNYGERASAFVVDRMLGLFAERHALNKTEIQQNLNKVQSDLNGLLEAEPELEKMGTTFTGVFRTLDVWYAAHIGDSRIYLFRPSERKLWHTWDHSLVGELMRNKEITIEAGRFHPMSNRISKAIIAHKDGKPASASIAKIDELQEGDIFMLCSDGVIEAWGDWDLAQLFSDKSLTFEQKCAKIANQCNERSKDNNTAVIVEIESADAFSYGSNEEIEWTSFDEVEADFRQWQAGNNETKSANESIQYENASLVVVPNNNESDNMVQSTRKQSRTKWYWSMTIILVAIMTIVLLLYFKPFGSKGLDGGRKVNESQKTNVSRSERLEVGHQVSSGDASNHQSNKKTEAKRPVKRTGNAKVSKTKTKPTISSQPSGRQSHSSTTPVESRQQTGTPQTKQPTAGSAAPSQTSGQQAHSSTTPAKSRPQTGTPQTKQPTSGSSSSSQASGQQAHPSTTPMESGQQTGTPQAKQPTSGSATSSQTSGQQAHSSAVPSQQTGNTQANQPAATSATSSQSVSQQSHSTSAQPQVSQQAGTTQTKQFTAGSTTTSSSSKR